MKSSNEKISSNSLSLSSGSKETKNSKLEKKILYYEEIIQKTILSAQKYKFLDIMSANDLNICIQSLETLFVQLNTIRYPVIKKHKYDREQIINKLQEINDELAGLFRSFGTESIKDIINICCGGDFIKENVTNEDLLGRYELITQYIHPISYKTMAWRGDSKPGSNSKRKVLQKNRIIEDFMIIETAENFDCFDLARTSKTFQTKVYGIKVALHNYNTKKTIVINGIVDDIALDCLNYKFIEKKIDSLLENKPKDPDFSTHAFDRFIKSPPQQIFIISFILSVPKERNNPANSSLISCSLLIICSLSYLCFFITG